MTGIKAIAKALGISIGTVDRALHGRPGVSEATRTRVLNMAQKLDYKPNVAARNLRLQQKVRIAVHLPIEIAAFFDPLRQGIRDAAAAFESAVELQFHPYPHLGEGDAQLFEQALQDKVDGIILAPGHPRQLRPLFQRAAEQRVPVVCVATDAPDCPRLTSVSADPYTGGAMAAELLTRCANQPGPVLVITGDLGTADHTEKLRGFAAQLSKMHSPLQIVPVVEAHDHPEEAAAKTRAALASAPELRAVYVTTANSVAVIDVLQQEGLLSQLSVITTDLLPDLVPLIRSGKIVGTLYQRPQTQGRRAFQSLYHYLVEGASAPPKQLLPPHVILQSNIDLFLDILDLDGL